MSKVWNHAKTATVPPGGGGVALPYEAIRDVLFFRVSFFSLNS